MNPKDLQRFWSKVIKTGSCWEWTGAKNKKGYGHFCLNYDILKSHRVSYELFKELIPQGLQIDHLCKNTSCVNPDHLEVVTLQENIRRGNHTNKGIKNRLKTHCPKGHEYSGKDKMGFRLCRICRNIINKKQYEKRRKIKTI